MKVLLVEPEFPIPAKSRNHRDFLPIGLLKIAAWHRKQNDNIRLIRGNERIPYFRPQVIKITSLFTYWSGYVWDSVRFYKEAYPEAKIVVGGIYASLMPEHCKQSGCDKVYVGVDPKAERCEPAYDLVDVDYQIIHASRGCIRKCKFCGTWKLEPVFKCKTSIKKKICSNRVVFYDNNFLANPNIERILGEMADAEFNGRVVHCESQCGLDGRLLNPKLAQQLKDARFESPRIAWDGGYGQKPKVERQIDMLVDVGFRTRDIYVFMVYNYKVDYYEMKKKIEICRKKGVQVSDCRYRPLDQAFDNYVPRKKQNQDDYFIHTNWSDRQVKLFRRKVREQNITIRYRFSSYNRDLENLGKRKRMAKSGDNRLIASERP